MDGKQLRAVALYGAAFLGIHCAFMPLLVLLLPRRVQLLATGDPTIALSWLLLAGGLIAGLSHIVGGMLSDAWFARKGDRRGIIWLGLAGLLIAYGWMGMAQSLLALALAIGFFQMCLNIAFAPLGALLADYIEDEQKGKVSAAMNAALPASTGVVWLAAAFFPSDSASGFWLTGLLSVALVIPLLVFWPFDTQAQRKSGEWQAHSADQMQALPLLDFALAWAARFLVQLGAAFVINYLFLYLATHHFGGEQSTTDLLGEMALPASGFALSLTFVAGIFSDRFGRRRLPMCLAAMTLCTGFAGLGQSETLWLLMAAFILFHAGLASFLSIDTALVAELLSASEKRGAWLGVMNLTNTLPAMVAPGLALFTLSGNSTANVLPQLFIASAVGALLAALAIWRIRSVR